MSTQAVSKRARKPSAAAELGDEQPIRICTEHNLVGEKVVSVAIKERSSNAVGLGVGDPMAMATAGPAMAVVITKLWKAGRTLRISFVGQIDQVIRDKIQHFAGQWLEHANLKFEFVPAGGDIRISCNPGGSWSYIGTDALTIAKNKPTMNFGWFTPETTDGEFSRVILHEFGHALGAIHEHQHPEGGIPWNKPMVYAYYARQGWDRDQVDQNIFAKYTFNQLNLTSYDKTSIMHYAVPKDLTTGGFEIGWNRALSAGDKKLAARIYPQA